uniref:E3 ubiquitin-protein ligase n=1 Tax=Gongylonema pulchrum TaxID=637853 RepID=A0A183D9V9_9BILA
LDDSLLRPTVSHKDIANFFLVISNYISFIVMHSGINVKGHRDLLTLDTMCRELTSNSSSLHSLRSIIAMVMVAHGKSPHSAIDVGYDSFLEFMRDERWNTQNAQPRAWLFQNCNEFGHFRTSERSNGLFAGTLPLRFF